MGVFPLTWTLIYLHTTVKIILLPFSVRVEWQICCLFVTSLKNPLWLFGKKGKILCFSWKRWVIALVPSLFWDYILWLKCMGTKGTENQFNCSFHFQFSFMVYTVARWVKILSFYCVNQLWCQWNWNAKVFRNLPHFLRCSLWWSCSVVFSWRPGICKILISNFICWWSAHGLRVV